MRADQCYRIGQQILELFCKQVNCGKEPTEQNCKGCLLITLSENLKFRYEMEFDIYSYICYFRNYQTDLIEKVKKVLQGRNKKWVAISSAQ